MTSKNEEEYQDMAGRSDTIWCIRNLLDNACYMLAKHLKLCGDDGKVRKAAIIEALSGHTCLACIRRRLLEKKRSSGIDAIYKECHRLAINVLVERLCWILNKLGYKVEISTEAELDFGTADIIIAVTRFGIRVKHQAKEVIIEVKSGNSMSLSQLFRYILSGRGNCVILWRIRKRQILVFDADSLKPLLAEFATMIYLRANRLISSPQTNCTHKPKENYQPAQTELQVVIQEFAEGLVETLPHVIATTLRQLGLQGWEAKLLDIKQA